MSYKNEQYGRMERLIKDGDVFYSDPGEGYFRGSPRSFCLKARTKNIYAPIRYETIKYFADNNISWWGGHFPTNHTLSSQIACINHLFPIRQDREAVLTLVKNIAPKITDVFTIASDEFDKGYIQFEAVSDTDHLNELACTRGSNCTSIDALILGRYEDGRNVIIIIEWKYTEAYGNENKAIGDKGMVRKNRYTDLINNSNQLSAKCHDIYYYEPFYQLMRQTLWAEQMILNKAVEKVQAEDFLHIHVIPPENNELLRKTYRYSCEIMEETWRKFLKDQDKYRIISPCELFSPIDCEKHKDLIHYLQTRYWQ